MEDADAAGLLVHPCTFRNENHFLPASLRRGAVPSDCGDANPDTAVAARALLDD